MPLTFLAQEFSGEFRALYDQILVRELAPEERVGSIWVPENAQHGPDGDKYLSRGVVVACGPGDKVSGCHFCKDTGTLQIDTTEAHEPEWAAGDVVTAECPFCPHKNGFPTRHEMNVNPGDTIIFDRPSNRKIVLNGEAYFVCHEQQHILAVVGS